MTLESGATDLRVIPEGTGFRILAFSEEGEEIGSANVETGAPWRFQGGYGYFIDSGVLDEDRYIAVVNDIEVSKPWARQGVGRAMLERAVALAEESDCDAIYVQASNVGRGDPVGFYLACEFEMVGSEGNYLRKTISEAHRIAHAFETSLGLLNRALHGPVHRWLGLCSSWIEDASELNRRVAGAILGDGSIEVGCTAAQQDR